LISVVRSFIEEKRLLTLSQQPVLVGLSGGSDSVALLYILVNLGYKCIAMHCNFHLRKQESDRDEVFSRRIAARWGVVFEKNDFDTMSFVSEHGFSIEMAARELRYRWFEELRQQYDAQAIAVAHHRDDNAETILLNLIRGAGIHGLCGMKPVNGHVIRPLLCVSKAEILTFLAENNIPFTDDSSNFSDTFKRNFLRINVLPLMKELNPAVSDALIRAAEHLTDVEAVFMLTVEDVRKKVVQQTDNQDTVLSIPDLLKHCLPAPKTMLYELLKPYGFNSAVTDNIFDALNGETGKMFYATENNYRLLVDRNRLIISKLCEESEDTFIIPSATADCSALPVRLSITEMPVNENFKIDTSLSVATFDRDKINFPLVLRHWRCGDRFVPFGMKGSKKVSDFFTDCKLSLFDKEKTWLLCSNDKIIWILGLRIDNRFRITKSTKNAIVINNF
jgi:tRNA(Ile)-lysidine synthase